MGHDQPEALESHRQNNAGVSSRIIYFWRRIVAAVVVVQIFDKHF